MTHHTPHSTPAHLGPAPRSSRDLFELASLDALGLLDDTERRDFEAAFAAAPAALKAQLRAQQGLMASIEDTLPAVNPPASLRARVLAAVAGAISATRLHEAGRVAPAILPSRGVNRVWRAAAIGFAAAAVVFGVTTIQMQAEYRTLDQAFRSNAATDHFIREFGPRFENLLMAPHTQVVKFAAAEKPAAGASAPNSMAVLLVDPKTRTGQFLARDLPAQSGQYQLVVLDSRGQQVGEAVLRITSSGDRGVARIAQALENFSLPDGGSLAVQGISPEGGRTVLRSQSL